MPRKELIGPKKRGQGHVVPFGYKVAEYDRQVLLPIESELKALKKAFKYYRSGRVTQQECTDWLVKVTGRRISKSGLFGVIYKSRKDSPLASRRRHLFSHKAPQTEVPQEPHGEREISRDNGEIPGGIENSGG